jgi:3-hydroxyisobutyrate dehydrogenase-like beta-hydroxyacid dehydrogenase
MSSNNGPRLAWIGLGNMGRGMVKNIVEKGTYTSPLLIYNRTTVRSEKLASSLPSDKVKVATTIEECVKGADIIFTCVGDDAAIKDTIDTALKVPESKQKLFVDCSTVHPDTTNGLTKTINDAGASFVACPVFGAPAMADNGQLVCVLAGAKSDVEKVRPFCKGVMGRAEVDYSDQPQGNASRMKIIGNTFILQMIESLSEGHVLAEKSGLGTENLHMFIEQMFPGPYTAYSNRLKSGDYYQREEPAFNAKLARKDYGHAKDLADKAGVQMKSLDVAGQHLKDVVDHAGDDGDIAGIYGAVRREAGLKFENQ